MGAEELGLHKDSVKSAPDVYLLDTSTLLWLIMEPHRLSEAAKAIWQNPKKLVAVSATWWDRRVVPYIDLETIPVREEHVSELLRLPDIHKDPFDRMLIAQARTEDMWLVTSDDHIREYQVRIVW